MWNKVYYIFYGCIKSGGVESGLIVNDVLVIGNNCMVDFVIYYY